MKLPPPSAPLAARIRAAVLLTVAMPVIWPLLSLAFFFVWLVMGLVIALMCVIILAMPVMALVGVEPDRTKEFKVTVDKDKAPELKLLLKEQGAKVEDA